MSSFQDHEKGSWYRQWKFWAFVGYALIIVVICLCLFVSIQEMPIWSLVPNSAFAFISINISEDSGGTASLLNSLESWLLQGETSRVKRFMIKRAFSSFLPERIIVIAATGTEAKPESLVIVKMTGFVRLVKVFPRQVDRVFFEGKNIQEEMIRGHRVKYIEAMNGRVGLGAYTIIGKTLVVGSSYSVLHGALTSYPQTNHTHRDSQHLTPLFLRGTELHSFVMFVDNGAQELSKVVSYIEQKYAFAPFPNIDAVEMVYGNIFLAADEVSGHITFISNDIDRLREVHSDVKYIYGVMRRIFRPLNITLEGEIQTEGSHVQFEFRVPDYINVMINYLNEKQGV
jgi:hypothetical protein